MIFAEHIPRKDGLVDFPSDKKIRKQLWPPEYKDHPAKYNCYLVWELTQYLTTAGQTILDPMSGVGTTMLASLLDRGVICIELVEKYYKIQHYVYNELKRPTSVMLLHGDCNRFLPLQADCIIFSPPYPTVTMGKYNAARDTGEDFTDYKNEWNAGTTNEFIYWQRMEKIYKKLLNSAPLMAFTIRDSIRDGKRQPYVQKSVDMCEAIGWKLQENILLQLQIQHLLLLIRRRWM